MKDQELLLKILRLKNYSIPPSNPNLLDELWGLISSHAKKSESLLATDGYSKEEMYLAVKLWQECELSLSKFCTRKNLLVKTSRYCYRKYKKEKGFSVDNVNPSFYFS
jgi:hypothetical protein